jgi:hypothetical protein
MGTGTSCCKVVLNTNYSHGTQQIRGKPVGVWRDAMLHKARSLTCRVLLSISEISSVDSTTQNEVYFSAKGTSLKH